MRVVVIAASLVDDSSLPKRRKGRISMPNLKEISAGAALVLFLFISASFLGPNENARIQHSISP